MKSRKALLVIGQVFAVMSLILMMSILTGFGRYRTAYAESDFEIKNGVLMKYKGNKKHVIIPDKVSDIADKAFAGKEFVTKITVPGSIKEIQYTYFDECINLKEVVLLDGVEVLGIHCFSYNPKLEKVSIPKTLYSLHSCSFQDCLKLQSIDVDPENPNFTSVDGVMFSKYKTSIYCYPAGKPEKSYTVPEGVYSIWNKSFAEASNLEEVIFPDTLTFIDYYAFAGCQGLKTVTFPDSLTEIGNQAFDSCYNLTTVNLPANLEVIDPGAFVGCNKLKNIKIDKDNPNFTSVSGVLYNKKLDRLVMVPRTIKTFTIPDTVKTIGMSAFSSGGLESITIPKNVREIEEHAFYDCQKLKSVKISNGVTKIGNAAFCLCKKLSDITFPKSIKDIGSYAFDSTPWLNNKKDDFLIVNKILVYYKGYKSNVSIPKGVVKIAPGAFYGNDSIMKITIPEGVTDIGDDAFGYCYSLEEVNLPGSLKRIGDRAFLCNFKLSLLFLPTGDIDIGEEAFKFMSEDIRVYVEYGSATADRIPYEDVNIMYYDKLVYDCNNSLLEVGGDTLKLSTGHKDCSKISWSSSNPSIAKVSNSGVVTGVSEGEAVITIKIGPVYKYCKVYVTAK